MQADATVASRFLVIGATLLPIGLACSAIGLDDIGSLVTIAGLAGVIAGLHTYGRAGPDRGPERPS